jgi:Domain of unknown function (DUF5753)
VVAAARLTEVRLALDDDQVVARVLIQVSQVVLNRGPDGLFPGAGLQAVGERCLTVVAFASRQRDAERLHVYAWSGRDWISRTQLGRLVEAAAAPHVTLQVLPFAKGSHAGLDGTFSLLEFPEQAELDVVFIECPAGGIYLEKPPDIRRYSLMFDHLRADALPPDESADFLALVRRDFA